MGLFIVELVLSFQVLLKFSEATSSRSLFCCVYIGVLAWIVIACFAGWPEALVLGPVLPIVQFPLRAATLFFCQFCPISFLPLALL